MTSFRVALGLLLVMVAVLLAAGCTEIGLTRLKYRKREEPTIIPHIEYDQNVGFAMKREVADR